MTHIGGADQTTPNLRIVARNDAPIPSGLSRLPSPELRLLNFDPRPRQPVDLVERLAGEWECRFVSDDLLRDERSVETHQFEPDEDHRPPEPTPLFEDYLRGGMCLPDPDCRDAPLGVHPAVMEIDCEIRRLQATSGADLAFSLQLLPGRLGWIDVEIRRAGGGWATSIAVAREVTRDALTIEIGRLERRSPDSPLKLDSVRITFIG